MLYNVTHKLFVCFNSILSILYTPYERPRSFASYRTIDFFFFEITRPSLIQPLKMVDRWWNRCVRWILGSEGEESYNKKRQHPACSSSYNTYCCFSAGSIIVFAKLDGYVRVCCGRVVSNGVSSMNAGNRRFNCRSGRSCCGVPAT